MNVFKVIKLKSQSTKPFKESLINQDEAMTSSTSRHVPTAKLFERLGSRQMFKAHGVRFLQLNLAEMYR